MKLPHFATLLLLPLTVAAAAIFKCQPNLPCWPSNTEWQMFNSTIGGMLVADIRPISSACYKATPEYNAVRCEEVTNNFHDSFWRANQPGAVQHTNWESYPPLNESCPLPSLLTGNSNMQCEQGSVSRYAVRARSAQDISTALKFASKHSIPVVIKNTGHDYLGRSTRRNALLIWTHFLREISFENQYGGWEPAGCTGDAHKENELLVRAEAGVMVSELTKAVSKQGRTVVAGLSGTIGVAGGYIQGGGHSPLGVWKGLASDHAVEFEAVLADGSFVKASPCTNPDLFWALRGGGGSTYGVVTSVVLRTHQDVPFVKYDLNVTIPILPNKSSEAANNTLWEIVTRWHSMALAVNDLGGSGYYYPGTNIPVPKANISANIFVANLLFFGQGDTSGVEKLFKGFHDWLYTVVGRPESGLVSSLISPPAQATDFLANVAPTVNNQGDSVIFGSRLLSRDLLSTPEGIQNTTAALRDINRLGGSLGGLYISPGPKPVDSGAHPAWRKAITHIITTQNLDPGSSFEKQAETKRFMSDILVPRLKKLDYDATTGKQTMGSYVNEADKGEVTWQDSFWGEKYGRLKRIKDKYDPEGVFWCRPCVGSEDWDLDGISRVPTS